MILCAGGSCQDLRVTACIRTGIYTVHLDKSQHLDSIIHIPLISVIMYQKVSLIKSITQQDYDF